MVQIDSSSIADIILSLNLPWEMSEQQKMETLMLNIFKKIISKPANGIYELTDLKVDLTLFY